MTKHTILMQGGAALQQVEPLTMSQDDFSERLAGQRSAPPTGVSLFRPRTGQALQVHPMAPLEHEYPPPALQLPNPERAWESLSRVTLRREALAGNGLFADAGQHETTAQFDILRTRILQAMHDRGWKRIAVTSPTHGCGKSLVAANLALSLARIPSCRSVLIDLELRHPDQARLFGLPGGNLTEMLTGEQPVLGHMCRAGHNLALALNGEPVTAAAETLLDPRVEDTLREIQEDLQPSIMVMDMPHALGNDDVIAMLPRIDAVLLVADATHSSAQDIRSCERIFEGRVPLMGVVLNRARETGFRRYRYRKG